MYAAILTGEDKQRATAFVTVVESKPMEGDKIVVLDADKIGAALAKSGKISLYGILFDFDKDVLRPESQPQLVEIAKVLKRRPKLRVEIVGHTDDRGGPAYNLDLSRRRAANVAAALTGEHGVAAERLTSSGAGLTAPVAPNTSEDGRAKNRRVALIAR